MSVDKFGRMSDAKTKDTGVSLTYINNNYIRSDKSTPVSGSIDMKDNTLNNVSNPVNPQDVAMKEYADKMVNNVGKYVDEKNAYIKREVNDFTKLLDHVKKMIDERLHIIVVNANYSGPLRQVEFQFSFGGNTINSDGNTGFLVPHSGRIKKIKLRVESIILVGGSLFSFLLTKKKKKKEKTQTRLANYICKSGHDISDEEKNGYNPLLRRCAFDNDLENYPISEGDLINIRTEKDYAFAVSKPSYNFIFLFELDPL